MGNEVVSKKTVAQFVHDAVEMETAIFTLEKMVEECKKRKKTIISEAEDNLTKAENNLKIKKDEYSGQKGGWWEEIQPPTKENIGCGITIFVGFLRGIAVAFVTGVILFLVLDVFFNTSMEEINEGITVLFMYGIIALTIIASYILAIRKRNAEYKNKIKEYEETCKLGKDCARMIADDLLQAVNHCKEMVSKAHIRLTEAEKKGQRIDLQIKEINSKRKQLQSDLSVFYNYDIIPPDYRYMDCVIILDQIFRNDLADTMREAIKIYEERVFRGSVIRGMDKICSMLGQLSSDMSAISLKLDMINNNVAHMSGDLERFNQRIASESAKNRAATEELIKETQLGRYTNEKLLESNKRLEYYAEEYRMGRMPIR